MGRDEEALVSYDKAIEIQPDYCFAWEIRGLVLFALRRFEEALASENKAIEIEPNNSLAWTNRGTALFFLGRFEQALASHDKAIEIESDNSLAWSNRGITLNNLGRFEQALASYDKAIEIEPDESLAWSDRGITLNNLGRFEQALASHEKAIEIEPDNYLAWTNRGIALHDLGRFEQALASHEKAIEIQPDGSQAWNNRGNVLNKLGRFEQALASHDKAIEIEPDESLAWFNRGNALADLGRFEQALASNDKAIEIKPDEYQTWINRGVSAGNSSSCDPFLASQSSIAKQNPELNKRGYEGALISHEEGLKHCLQDTHPEGWGKLHQAIGNAHYSQARNASHPRDYWKQAANSYNQALKTLTVTDFPELHLEVLQDLIRVRLDLKDIAKATELQRQGTDLLRRFLNECQSPAKKQQLALKFAGFQQFTVDLAVQSGDVVQALEFAEAGKNACLSWILGDESEFSPDWEEIKQLVNNTTAIVYWHLSPAALHTFILTNDSPSPIVLEETEFSNQTQRLYKFENWVKDWNEKYTNYRKGKTDNSNSSSQVTEDEIKNWRDNLPELLEELAEILDIPAIIKSIKNSKSKIQNLILVSHRDLHRFPIHALFPDNFIITYLPSAKIGLRNLRNLSPNLSPARREALNNPTPHSLVGKGAGGLGFSLHNNSQIKLLSVEHPPSSGHDLLEFAQVESEAITRMFPNCTRIPSEQATQNAVKSALSNNYSIFHFTGHGEYNFHNPVLSELKLAKEDKITLENICKFDLRSYKLVTLAACETAITGNHTITSEYVGLASGFIRCGVSHVVSTLWTVESAASALVMIEFYQRLQQEKSEAVALAEATNWLRNITVDELAKWYTEQIAKIPDNQGIMRRFLQRQAIKITNNFESSKALYSHPYYWAAFTITGNL